MFANKHLQRLAQDEGYRWKLGPEIADAYRRRIEMLAHAEEVSDIPNLRSINLEKLKGDRRGQWSLRLRGPWRLIMRFMIDAQGRVAIIIDVVDYHR